MSPGFFFIYVTNSCFQSTGTRADICELLKSSQFINPAAADQILQSIVSGALDRMHTEHDPCVRYDPKRKIWIYLHRNRTEEEFERMHQQFQGISKHKKQSNRKVKNKTPKPVVTPTKVVSMPVVDSTVTKVSPVVTPPKVVTVVQCASPTVAKLVTSSQPPALSVSLTQPPPLLQTQPQPPQQLPSLTQQQNVQTTIALQPQPVAVVASPLQSPVSSMPQLSALSSIQSPLLIQRPTTSQPPVLNKIQVKKLVVKPELVPIKQPFIQKLPTTVATTNAADKFIELIDVDAPLELQTTTVLINTKPMVTSSLTPTLVPTTPTLQQQQQSIVTAIPAKMPSLIVDKKAINKVTGKAAVAATAKSFGLIASVTTTSTPMVLSGPTAGLTTPIKVSTSSGIQTVFVSAPTPSTTNTSLVTGISPQHRTNATILASAAVTSTSNQSILVSAVTNRSQSPLYVPNNATGIMTTAKRIIKPPPLIAQSSPASGHSYIIPISLGPVATTNKTVVTVSSNVAGVPSIVQQTNSPTVTKLYKSVAMPALTSTSAPRMSLLHQNKLIARAVPPGKSLISPSVAAANISIQQQQQQQKLIAVQAPTAIQVRPIVQQQHKFTAVAKGQTINTGLQPRQIVKNIITTQQPKRVNNTVSLISNTVVVSAAPHQFPVAKSVIVSQQQLQPSTTPTFVQKTIATPKPGAVTATVLSSSATTPATTPASTSLLNPQIIQIHQAPTQQPSSTMHQNQHQQSPLQSIAKVQTVSATLTPQQQQNLLQSLKQTQQLRVHQSNNTATIVQHQQQQHHQPSSQQQQSLIIKQQHMLQQIQKQLQQQMTPKMTTVGGGGGGGGNTAGVSLLSTNQIPTVITSVATSTGVGVPNQSLQTVARIIKTSAGPQLIQQQQHLQQQPQPMTLLQASNSPTVSSPSAANNIRTTPETSPIMAKVLTNTGGQLISLESLLQKQGIGPGATIRVAGTKPGQTSLIQLAGAPGSQITQYAVVSQGRNLISLSGQPQRLVTTQAATNLVSTVNTTPVGTLKTATTIVQQQQQQQHSTIAIQGQSSIGHHQSQQSRIIQTSAGVQMQSISAQQLVNAKVLGVQQIGNSPTTVNRMKNSIRMLNASNLNITHIDGKPLLITGKPQNVSMVQQSQQQQQHHQRTNVVWQTTNQPTTNNDTNYITGTGTHHPQTVLFGNQFVKMHPHNQMTSSATVVQGAVSSGNIITSSSVGSGMILTNSGSGNSMAPRTVMLGSSGQTIRVQSPVSIQQAGGATTSGVGGHLVLGQAMKVRFELDLMLFS